MYRNHKSVSAFRHADLEKKKRKPIAAGIHLSEQKQHCVAEQCMGPFRMTPVGSKPELGKPINVV